MLGTAKQRHAAAAAIAAVQSTPPSHLPEFSSDNLPFYHPLFPSRLRPYKMRTTFYDYFMIINDTGTPVRTTG